MNIKKDMDINKWTWTWTLKKTFKDSDVGSLIPVKSLIRYLKSISERAMRSKGLGWRKPYLVGVNTVIYDL
jgi:hypothetical protein